MRNLAQVVIYILALLAGLLAGFFIVFNSIFSDVSGMGERLFSLLLVIVVYGALGLVCGYLTSSPAVGIPLAAPAVLIVIWYTFSEPGNLPLHLLYIATTLAAAFGGAYGGARLRARRPAVSGE